mgnify:CR=1 FL=1
MIANVSERTLYALRFARFNPQAKAVHPLYEKSVIDQCKSGRVIAAVDTYRKDSQIIRTAGYRKVNAAASGNCITIFVQPK